MSSDSGQIDSGHDETAREGVPEVVQAKVRTQTLAEDVSLLVSSRPADCFSEPPTAYSRVPWTSETSGSDRIFARRSGSARAAQSRGVSITHTLTTFTRIFRLFRIERRTAREVAVESDQTSDQRPVSPTCAWRMM